MPEASIWTTIGSGLPAAIALAGVYVAASRALRNQREIATRAAREDAYASIAGSQYLFSQALVTYLEARAHMHYHEHKWRLAGYPKESLDLDETKRWMLNGESAAIDATKELGALAAAVAKARVSFPRSQELDEHYSAVLDDYCAPRVVPPDPDVDLVAL